MTQATDVFAVQSAFKHLQVNAANNDRTMIRVFFRGGYRVCYTGEQTEVKDTTAAVRTKTAQSLDMPGQLAARWLFVQKSSKQASR